MRKKRDEEKDQREKLQAERYALDRELDRLAADLSQAERERDETIEKAAGVCEQMVVGGRAWNEGQAIAAEVLFAAAKAIRVLLPKATEPKVENTITGDMELRARRALDAWVIGLDGRKIEWSTVRGEWIASARDGAGRSLIANAQTHIDLAIKLDLMGKYHMQKVGA